MENQSSKPGKVLVAGAAGFLGSHLTDALIAKGYEVVAVDNFITGNRENLAHLEGNPLFTFVEHDLIEPLPEAITKHTYSKVASLACPASPIDYQEKPLETMRVSSVGVDHLLALAHRDHARFTHTSTSEVYGDPLEHPQTEKYWGNVNSYGERSCYDEGKRFAEALIFSYRKMYKVNTGITRIFNTYGPRMRPSDGRVMTNFIKQALNGEDITVFGDGSQTRSFCFVDDQIKGQMAMLESDFEGPVNIGNPGEFTIRQLAEKVIALTGSSSKITSAPLPSDDPKQRQPDISLAREKLNWEPTIDLEEGLKRMIEWMKSSKA